MNKDWMLMHVYITEDTYVNASGPDFYNSENDAIEAALQNLSVIIKSRNPLTLVRGGMRPFINI